jgi:hypothetical protein
MSKPLRTEASCSRHATLNGLTEGEILSVVSVITEYTLKLSSKAKLLAEIVSVGRLLGGASIGGVEQLHPLSFFSQTLTLRSLGFKHAVKLPRSFTRGYGSSSSRRSFPLSQDSLHELRLGSL